MRIRVATLLRIRTGNEEALWQSGDTQFPNDSSRDGRFLLYSKVDPKTKLTRECCRPERRPGPAEGNLDYLGSHPQSGLYRQWGHETAGRWSDTSGMLGVRQELFRVIRCLARKAGHEFLPYEGIYAAAHFGGLAVRMATVTGSRLGEVQQIAQSGDCLKKLLNVGPKGATRWLLRLVPKGQKTNRADYYIDEDTKNLLLDVIRFQMERCGDKSIPIVAGSSYTG